MVDRIATPAGRLSLSQWGIPITQAVNEHDEMLSGSGTIASVTAVDNTSRTTTSTSFTQVMSPAGLCGVAFVAPQSGKIYISMNNEISNSGANFTLTSYSIRTGSVVGSGTLFQAASQDETIRNDSTTIHRYGVGSFASGLTPGQTYNIVLEHSVQLGTGTFTRRRVVVLPQLF